jgi:hypothetical protein
MKLRQDIGCGGLGVIVFIFFLVSISVPAYSQTRYWDGEGGDDEWFNPFNWDGDLLPDASSSVVLDNSVIGDSYIVRLPAGSVSIVVRSIDIQPAGGSVIELILPETNTASPSLQCIGTVYGLTIHANAVFRNASGALAGTPVLISDSIRILSGGRYVHQTARAHAANVSVLSRLEETSAGIFEFDVPDASTTISMSDRVFGTLILSGASHEDVINYTGAGTRPVTIRGDLIVRQQVALSLNFTDTLHVRGNILQEGGTINLSTGQRRLVVSVQGDIRQDAGVITETGTSEAVIVMAGEEVQTIYAKGIVQNSIDVKISNEHGVFVSRSLQLPQQLMIEQGFVKVDDASVLTVTAGEISGTQGYVEGKLRIINEGGLDCKFPVGANGRMRWMGIKGAAGIFTVEYRHNNPLLLASNIRQPLHHISALEHWVVESDGSTAMQVELSFDDANSGGVTDLASLRVACLETDEWTDHGSSQTTGSAGSSGSVTSHVHQIEGKRQYTLASTESNQNPLPVNLVTLQLERRGQTLALTTLFDPQQPIEFIEVQQSDVAGSFRTIGVMTINLANRRYEYFATAPAVAVDYRLKVVLNTGGSFYSNIVRISAGECSLSFQIAATVVFDRVRLKAEGCGRCPTRLVIVDVFGRKVAEVPYNNEPEVNINVMQLRTGLYRIFQVSCHAQTIVSGFLRR